MHVHIILCAWTQAAQRYCCVVRATVLDDSTDLQPFQCLFPLLCYCMGYEMDFLGRLTTKINDDIISQPLIEQVSPGLSTHICVLSLHMCIFSKTFPLTFASLHYTFHMFIHHLPDSHLTQAAIFTALAQERTLPFLAKYNFFLQFLF